MKKLTRTIVFGFVAGGLSHLVFQGALGTILYSADITSAPAWSFTPVAPFGVPKTLSLAIWAGLWGIGYSWAEPHLRARFGTVAGGIIFAFAALLSHWFIAQPLKGKGLGGGFNLAVVPIELSLTVTFGVGLVVCYGLLTRSTGRANVR